MGSIEENLARNLRRLRKSRGLTLIELAKLAKVDKGTLNKWENQKQGFRLGNLKTVADALECSVEDLTAPPRAENRDTSDLIGAIVMRLSFLNESQLNMVLKLVSGFNPRANERSDTGAG